MLCSIYSATIPESHANVHQHACTVGCWTPLHYAVIQVDAALDESNQALVATLIKVLFLMINMVCRMTLQIQLQPTAGKHLNISHAPAVTVATNPFQNLKKCHSKQQWQAEACQAYTEVAAWSSGDHDSGRRLSSAVCHA